MIPLLCQLSYTAPYPRPVCQLRLPFSIGTADRRRVRGTNGRIVNRTRPMRRAGKRMGAKSGGQRTHAAGRPARASAMRSRWCAIRSIRAISSRAKKPLAVVSLLAANFPLDRGLEAERDDLEELPVAVVDRAVGLL